MKKVLSREEAESILPDGKYVHCFVNPGNNVLMGADWSREEVMNAIAAGQPELAGKMARGMDHALAVTSNRGYLFFATDKAKVDALDPQPQEAER